MGEHEPLNVALFGVLGAAAGPQRKKALAQIQADARMALNVFHVDLMYGEDRGRNEFQNLDDLYKDGKVIHAAIVSTPTSGHFTLAKGLLERGAHILVEKPLTSNLEDAGRLLEVAKTQQCHLKVGLNRHHGLSQRAALAILRSGLLGDVIDAEAAVGHGQFLDVETAYRGGTRVDENDEDVRRAIQYLLASCVGDLFVHGIDLGPQIIGEEFATVQAYSRASALGGIAFFHADYAVDETHFRLTSSYLDHRPWLSLNCTVRAQHGTLTFSMAALNPNACHEKKSADFVELTMLKPAPISEQRFREILEKHGLWEKRNAFYPEPFPPRPRKKSSLDFDRYRIEFKFNDTHWHDETLEFLQVVSATCRSERLMASAEIKEKFPLYRTAQDGYNAQLLIEAALRSAKNGAPVRIADVTEAPAAPVREAQNQTSSGHRTHSVQIPS